MVGAGALWDDTVFSMKRNFEGRSKEGDGVGLNTSLLLGEVTHLWQGLILAVPKFVMVSGMRKRLAEDFNIQAA